MKIALIGGGGFRAPMIYAGLLRRQTPVDELVLHDLDPGRLQRVDAVMAGMAEERGHRIPTRTTTRVEDALEDASFILCAIRVGGMEGRARDERLAQDAGVLGQETIGAAGILYALRTLPVMVEIARLTARAAPRAWFLNFTNPAGLVTEAVQRHLGPRAIGICDSPAALTRRVAHALHRDPATLRFAYSGLNHLGWLTAVHDAAGDDLLPALLDAADSPLQRTEEGRLFGPDWLRTLRAVPNEYLFYFQRTRHAIATVAAGGATRGETILAQQRAFYDAPPLPPAEALARWRGVRGERERTYLQEAGDGIHDVPSGDEGGYADVALQVLDALVQDRPTTLIANVANGTTLPYLPADAVVEVPCLLSRAGAQPLAQPPLPAHARGMVETIKEVERATIHAALDGDRRALLRAFALHPLAGGLDTARELARRATPTGAPAHGA